MERDGKSKTVQADTKYLSQFGADYGWQTFFTNDRTRGVQFYHTRTPIHERTIPQKCQAILPNVFSVYRMHCF